MKIQLAKLVTSPLLAKLNTERDAICHSDQNYLFIFTNNRLAIVDMDSGRVSQNLFRYQYQLPHFIGSKLYLVRSERKVDQIDCHSLTVKLKRESCQKICAVFGQSELKIINPQISSTKKWYQFLSRQTPLKEARFFKINQFLVLCNFSDGTLKLIANQTLCDVVSSHKFNLQWISVCKHNPYAQCIADEGKVQFFMAIYTGNQLLFAQCQIASKGLKNRLGLHQLVQSSLKGPLKINVKFKIEHRVEQLIFKDDYMLMLTQGSLQARPIRNIFQKIVHQQEISLKAKIFQHEDAVYLLQGQSIYHIRVTATIKDLPIIESSPVVNQNSIFSTVRPVGSYNFLFSKDCQAQFKCLLNIQSFSRPTISQSFVQSKLAMMIIQQKLYNLKVVLSGAISDKETRIKWLMNGFQKNAAQIVQQFDKDSQAQIGPDWICKIQSYLQWLIKQKKNQEQLLPLSLNCYVVKMLQKKQQQVGIFGEFFQLYSFKRRGFKQYRNLSRLYSNLNRIFKEAPAIYTKSKIENIEKKPVDKKKELQQICIVVQQLIKQKKYEASRTKLLEASRLIKPSASQARQFFNKVLLQECITGLKVQQIHVWLKSMFQMVL